MRGPECAAAGCGAATAGKDSAAQASAARSRRPDMAAYLDFPPGAKV
jgi:hypothetical protein